MQNYVYDTNFFGNILIVGRAGCGKTFFTQKLAINIFFGTLQKVEWVSSIKLRTEREAEIEYCFLCSVDFHCPKGLETFNDLLDEIKGCSNTAKTKALDTYSSEEVVNNGSFGEETKRDQLIVIDVVSGLADESKKFASFLTVTRKFNYSCVYIFHTIYPEKTNWKIILSQTNICNIFLANVSLTSVQKILEGICIRKTRKYIPQSALWISRLFIELANKNDRVCLTLDCSRINEEAPGRFRTKVDKRDFQTCYYNVADDEQVYNEFVSKRINKSETTDKIQFSIIHLKSKTNKEENLDATAELCDLIKKDTTRSGAEKKKS